MKEMLKKEKGGEKKAVKKPHGRELFMIGLILVSVVILSIMSDAFLSRANLVSVLVGMVPNAILAIGMCLTLAQGTFDLSVGGLMAFSGTLVGVLMLAGVPILLAVLITLLVGVLVGCINGFLITKIKVDALIATYGIQNITRSGATILTGGYSVYGFAAAFGIMGSFKILSIPLMVWFAIVLIIIFDILYRKLKYFRQSFYLGSNPQAALLSGINIDRVKFQAFVISAVCASIAGMVMASRIMAGTPTAGQGIEMEVIAACVIGGCSLKGGEGTLAGAFLGVIFLSLVSNALTLLSVSQYWQGVVTGVILIVAVSSDMLLKRRKAKAVK